MKEQQPTGSVQKLRTIADRYRVQCRLGRGGMAEVYHVVDEVTHRDAALKILLQETSQNPHLAGLFEREFHTLAQLAHPRIIEVYDYGFHWDRSYYTMELLDGSDLRKLAPVEWHRACRLLRDVASSLALLHSRRLIHRDISARNVRCDRDGRAKLIDFGALSPIGKSVKLIGTAAFVAPEAINHQPLDQRTDLYALGSLAYLLITGRYAYRAHYITHLKDAWRSRPPSVTELKPEVPRPLSDLIMSLLSLDRMARPVYASEVVEMLSAYAALEPDDTMEVKQAYLATPKLVGRDLVVTDLLKRIIRILRSRGGQTLLFEGPSGIGRSRLLAEFVLQGKVLGASVLTTSAEASVHGAYGVALDLTEQLFETCYDYAVQAIRPHLALLREVFPNLVSLIQVRAQNRTTDTLGFDTMSQELGDESREYPNPLVRSLETRLPLTQSEKNVDDAQLRPKIQKALLDLFLVVSRRRQIIIAVDDFHLVDEHSTALISSLALASRSNTLMLAVTAEQDRIPTSSAAYEALSRIAHRIEMVPLDQKSVGFMLRSVFGDVPNIQLLARRLYGISKGNPRAAMQLAQHLVDRGTVSYRSGTWTIPTQIDTKDLPDSLVDALRTKVNGLSSDALVLVQTLALSTARTFSFNECQFLTEDADVARLTQQLNLLVAIEILGTDGQFYSFNQEALRAVLIELLDEETTRCAHLKLAKLFQRRDRLDFHAVQHLMKARQYHDSLDLLIEHAETTLNVITQKREAQFDYIQSFPDNWANTIRNAIEFAQRSDRPKRDRYLIHYFFVRIGAATGFVKKGDFKSVIDQLFYDSGLDIYHEIGVRIQAQKPAQSEPQTGMSAGQQANPEELAQRRLSRAVQLAQQRYDDTDARERGFPPNEALALLPGAVIAAAGLATASNDYSVLEMLPSLEPILPLSPLIKVLEDHVQAVGHIIGARYDNARQKYLALLQWVAGPDSAGMDQAYREYMHCAFNFAIGLIESVGIPSALERAAAVERHPIYRINAWMIRMVYYLIQGDVKKTQKCQETLELLQLRSGSAQMFEGVPWLMMLVAYSFFDDLTGVNQSMSRIEKMTKRFDSWGPIYQYACAVHHRIRGESAFALKELEEILNRTVPGRDPIWAYTAGEHLRVLVDLDRLPEAHTLALGYLKQVEQTELEYIAYQILLPLAIIEAQLGHEASAEKRVERVITKCNEIGLSGPLLGGAYETGARVSIYADDHKKFRTFAQLCKGLYQAGQHPILIAKYNKLMEDARLVYLGMAIETKQVSELTTSLTRGGDLTVGLQDYLAKYQGEQQLYQGALDLMIKRTGSSEGYLYIATQNALQLAVQIAVNPAPDQILEDLQASFTRALNETSAPEISETETETVPETGELQSVATVVELVDSTLLLADVDGRPIPLGAVILRYEPQSYERVEQSFFEAIASCLYRRMPEKSRAALEQKQQTERAGQSRYLIDNLLGEGGMASVYEVRDRETTKRMALKRARVSTHQVDRSSGSDDILARRNKLENRLRREYQMLKSLAHPRIVQVFDFGVDDEGPYYTMEMLEGSSLRQKAPLDWKEACVLLRDLASALSFLHARRLLHRDVSPRNLGMTKDNHVKLMDFGTTAPIGAATECVGTPPFIPPEAVYRQKLDQRSDLYSFGALAYWLLTGRHAFAARNHSELKELWSRQPLSVSEVVTKLETLEPIPEALNQLVMSLLSIDPLARPSSAAELLERLSAIASLPIDEQFTVPQAYLTTPTLLGREQELLLVRKKVIRSLRDRGGTILIQGASGVGRSRLLDATVMVGKLAGMVVLKSESGGAVRDDYAVVKTLARQLLEEIPEIARSAATPHLALLTRIVPEFGDSVRRGAGLSSEEGDPDTDYSQPSPSLHEFRPQIQTALRDWIAEIGNQRAIMLAVDDLHLIDEPSAAFFALLSPVIVDKRLLVVATVLDCTETPGSALAINSIREASTHIEIKELSPQDTQQLLQSVFGQASHVRLLADRLYAISQGNPSVIMQLAQHLVDTQVIRYQGGAWMLPAQIEGTDLPNGLKDTFIARIQKLDSDTLELAQTMALSPDQSFTFEECLFLTGHKDADRLALSIDELLVFEIIISDGERYTSSHRGWVSVLQERLDKNAERESHRRLAEVFSSRDTTQFRVGYHLIGAGDEDKAIDVLLDFSHKSKELNRQNPEAFSQLLQTLPRDWFQTLQTAIALAKRRGRPPAQIFVLQSRLSALGTITGTVDRRQMQELFDRLYRDSGLDLYHELGECPDEQRIKKALECAQQRYDSTPESERVLAPLEAIQELARTIAEGMSFVIVFSDYSFWQSLPSIKPFASLSPALEIIDKLSEASGDNIAGRLEQSHQKMKETVERLKQPDQGGFEGAHYRYILFGSIYVMGLIEALMGRQVALERATMLETSSLLKVNAWRIRELFYLWQSASAETLHCKKQVETLQIQSSPSQTWMGAIIRAKLRAYCLADDLSNLKDLMNDVEKMASVASSWKPVRQYVLGEYHRIRGDYANGLDELNEALRLTVPGRHWIWALIVDAYLTTLLALEKDERVKNEAPRFLQTAENESLGLIANHFRMSLAIAQARTKDVDSAVKSADVAIERFEKIGVTGLGLGRAYETRARVAILLDDETCFMHYAQLCADQYRVDNNSLLRTKYEKLMQEARRAELAIPPLHDGTSARPTGSDKDSIYRYTRVQLDRCKNSEQCAERALEILAEHCEATGGYLFGLTKNGLAILSKNKESVAPEQILETVDTYLEAELKETTRATITELDEEAAEGSNPIIVLKDGTRVQLVIVHGMQKEKPVVVGVAVLIPAHGHLLSVNPQVVHAICDALLDTGRVTSRIAA